MKLVVFSLRARRFCSSLKFFFAPVASSILLAGSVDVGLDQEPLNEFPTEAGRVYFKILTSSLVTPSGLLVL